MLNFLHYFIPDELIFGTLHRTSVRRVQSIDETIDVNLLLLPYIEPILPKPVLVVIKVSMLLLKWSFVNHLVVS